MKYLVKTVETYRIDTENEVERFLQELKKDNHFTIGKYVSTKKVTKDDEYYKFEVTKLFNEEKNPDLEIEVNYNTYNIFNQSKEDEEDE